MASCANRRHFSLLQHSFPFWFLQICEFANASPGPPTKVAYLRTKNLIFVILERRSGSEFLAELYRKMFLLQTPDFVNFVLAASGDVRNSSGDGEWGKTSRRYPEFATVGHIEILDIGQRWTAAQQWKWTTIDCNTRLAALFESRWNEEIVRNRKWQYYSFCDHSLMPADSGPPSKYLCNSTSIYCWLDQMWLLTKHFIRYCLYLHISLLTRLLDGEYW